MEIEPFKIKVTPEQSRIVQEVLFANGIRWCGSACSVTHTDKRYLLMIDNLIGWCELDSYYSEDGISELTFEQFQELYCQTQPKIILEHNPKGIHWVSGHLKSIADKAIIDQQEIDSRLHEYGYNIPQQELVPRPDDRLNKIIERLDGIIELGNKIVEILCAPTDGDEIDDFEVKFHD